jgi:hypothetical protein
MTTYGITDVGTRLAYEVLLDGGDRATVFTTDLDLDLEAEGRTNPPALGNGL